MVTKKVINLVEVVTKNGRKRPKTSAKPTPPYLIYRVMGYIGGYMYLLKKYYLKHRISASADYLLYIITKITKKEEKYGF